MNSSKNRQNKNELVGNNRCKISFKFFLQKLDNDPKFISTTFEDLLKYQTAINLV